MSWRQPLLLVLMREQLIKNGSAQVVYTATADDSGDISGGVTFGLSDDSDCTFSIDAASGEVTFAGGADYRSTISL